MTEEPEFTATTTSTPVEGGFIDTTQIVFTTPIEIDAQTLIGMFMGWGFPERGTPEYRTMLRKLTDRDEDPDLPDWDAAADHYGWRFLLDFADTCMARTAHHMRTNGLPSAVASMAGRFQVSHLLREPSEADVLAGSLLPDKISTGDPATDAEAFTRRLEEAERLSRNLPRWTGPLQECLDAHLNRDSTTLTRGALMKYPTLRTNDKEARLVMLWASMVWLAVSDPKRLLGENFDMLAQTDRALSGKVSRALHSDDARRSQYMQCPKCGRDNSLDLQLDRTPDIYGQQVLRAVCRDCGTQVSFQPYEVDAKGHHHHGHAPGCPERKGHRR